MINIYIGDMPNVLKNAKGYFKGWFPKKLLLEDFFREVIRDIDDSEVTDVLLIKSNILGTITHDYLSGGIKAILLLKYCDVKLRFERMGENCYRYVQRISDDGKDVTLSVNTLLSIFYPASEEIYTGNYGICEAKILNTGNIIKCGFDWVKEYNKVWI